MIQRLKKYYRRQEFFPGVLGVFTNPFFFARRGLVKNIQGVSNQVNGRMLDVGCGSKPYRELFSFTEYIGIDIENPGHDHSNEDVDIFYDGNVIPFGDGSFDAVITNQVFEHVFTPAQFLSELNRVLKTNGMLLLTVPFVWDEHEQPNDFARYSSFGLKYVLQQNGFEIISSTKSVKDFRVIFQLAILFFYKKFVTRNFWLNSVLTLILIAPLNILGLAVSKVLPDNQDLYLDNVILAKKIS
jgi:SAM-dependent methyltransferase